MFFDKFFKIFSDQLIIFRIKLIHTFILSDMSCSFQRHRSRSHNVPGLGFEPRKPYGASFTDSCFSPLSHPGFGALCQNRTDVNSLQNCRFTTKLRGLIWSSSSLSRHWAGLTRPKPHFVRQRRVEQNSRPACRQAGLPLS